MKHAWTALFFLLPCLLCLLPKGAEASPEMCAKLPPGPRAIVRLAKIEVYPEYREAYVRHAAQVGEISLLKEPGVLVMYALADRDDPCRITILEHYASPEAYEAHLASPHFQAYKKAVAPMVKSLTLTDVNPLNPANRLTSVIANPD